MLNLLPSKPGIYSVKKVYYMLLHPLFPRVRIYWRKILGLLGTPINSWFLQESVS